MTERLELQHLADLSDDEVAVKSRLAYVPDLSDLMVGDTPDRARLTALAGETALAAGRYQWLTTNATKMRNLAARLSDHADHETEQNPPKNAHRASS